MSKRFFVIHTIPLTAENLIVKSLEAKNVTASRDAVLSICRGERLV